MIVIFRVLVLNPVFLINFTYFNPLESRISLCFRSLMMNMLLLWLNKKKIKNFVNYFKSFIILRHHFIDL